MYFESLLKATAVTDLVPLGNLKLPLTSAVLASQMNTIGE